MYKFLNKGDFVHQIIGNEIKNGKIVHARISINDIVITSVSTRDGIVEIFDEDKGTGDKKKVISFKIKRGETVHHSFKGLDLENVIDILISEGLEVLVTYDTKI